jgi:hypothetical protein
LLNDYCVKYPSELFCYIDENVLLTERSILYFSFYPVFVSGTLFSRGEGNGGGNKTETCKIFLV